METSKQEITHQKSTQTATVSPATTMTTIMSITPSTMAAAALPFFSSGWYKERRGNLDAIFQHCYLALWVVVYIYISRGGSVLTKRLHVGCNCSVQLQGGQY